MRPKAFALTAAALLVLVGFSAAVAEPLAVNSSTLPTVVQSEGADRGNGLTATGKIGGEPPASIPGLPFLLEIIATVHLAANPIAPSTPRPPSSRSTS